MKRKAGDRWGMIKIDKTTGIKESVQIGYWETTLFPYRKQAQEYADGLNLIAYEHNYNCWYEARFVGNTRTGYVPNDDVVYTGGWLL